MRIFYEWIEHGDTWREGDVRANGGTFRLVKELPARDWIEITPDREPTAADGNSRGCVLYSLDNDVLILKYFADIPKGATHFLPIPKREVKPLTFCGWLAKQSNFKAWAMTPENHQEWLNDRQAEYVEYIKTARPPV